MWFGTLDGLNRYDGNDFKLYRHDPDDPHSLSDNTIRGLIADHTGTLWIGTWAKGLNQFDRSTERFIRYHHNPGDPRSLSNDSIRSVIEDRTGSLWVGTIDGLNRFDRDTKQFTRYLHEPDNPKSLGIILSKGCMKTAPGYFGLALAPVSISLIRQQNGSSTTSMIPMTPRVSAKTLSGQFTKTARVHSGLVR